MAHRTSTSTKLGLAWTMVVGLLVCGVGPAGAQSAPPSIDHYLLYELVPSLELPSPRQVYLSDQFFTNKPTNPAYAAWLGVPVSKDGGEIFDQNLHLTGYNVQPPDFSFPSIHVGVTNQFGDSELDLLHSAYMINPAVKYPQPGQTIPVANHYRVYGCQGPPVNRSVTLVDQFRTTTAQVTDPLLFLVPAAKTVDGVTYPIVRPDAHFVCYGLLIGSFDPYIAVTFLDQFMTGSAFIPGQCFLCVPTIKHVPTPTETSTWGSVKALFR
jgi:hypothetical protein